MDQFKEAQIIMLPRDITLEKTDKLDYASGLGIKAYAKGVDFKGNVSLYIVSDDEIKEGDWCYDIHNYRPVRYSHRVSGLYFVRSTKYTKESDGYSVERSQLKKIIATTDTSLDCGKALHGDFCLNYIDKSIKFQRGEYLKSHKILPQPSQQFIEKFVESYKGEVITDVLVAYEEYSDIYDKSFLEEGYTVGIAPRKLRLKVNPKDNTITIKKLKDSWNRDEVISLMRLSIQEGLRLEAECDINFNIEQWIKEKL
jgi:hypothetical protein